MTDVTTNAALNEEVKIELCQEVQRHLENVLKQRKITNYTFEVTSGAVKGDNYMGVIYKAVVKALDENGKPVRFDWIVKCAPQAKMIRDMMEIGKFYVRESYIYEVFFPTLKNFHLEYGILTSFGTTPPLVTTYSVAPNETIVMEDMKALGYVLRDRKEPLGYNHVRLVMETYGKLHAFSFALRDQRPDEFQDIKSKMIDMFYMDEHHLNPMTQGHVAMINNKILESLDPVEDRREIEIFKKYSEKLMDELKKVTERATDGKYSVFTHGDCWVNNMLFKYDVSNVFKL